MSVVFVARVVSGQPRAADDATNLKVVSLDALPQELCFDHGMMLRDYITWKRTGQRPRFGPGFRGAYEDQEAP
jgi:8-oxo-dGTP diphosphatase